MASKPRPFPHMGTHELAARAEKMQKKRIRPGARDKARAGQNPFIKMLKSMERK